MSQNWQREAGVIAEMRRRRGTASVLRRLVRGGSPIDVTVIAWFQGYGRRDTRPLESGIVQQDFGCKISDDAIQAAGWPGPPRHGDQIITGGQLFTVASVDTSTAGDTVLSHTLQIRGGS